MRLEIPADDGGAEALLECGCIQPVPVESDAILSSSSSDDDGNKNGVEGDGEDNQTDEKDERNSNNESEEEDDNLWQNELSTIGKEMKGEKYK